MFDLFFPTEPWVGLLDAFGVVVMLLTFVALGGTSERVRVIAAMVGAVFVGTALATALGPLVTAATFLTVWEFDDGEGGRQVLDIVLVAAGVAVGVAAVLWAHMQADVAAADLAADELAMADIENDVVDDDVTEPDAGLTDVEPDPYTLSLRRRVAARPWIDVAALVVALALPVSMFGLFGRGPSGFGFERDVTALMAVHHIVNGFVLAAPLLVLLRNGLADLRLAVAAFGLLAVHALVMPIWPGFFANEFWSAFGAGIVAGLFLAAGFSLVKAAIPDDRAHVIAGALLAVGLITLTSTLYIRSFVNAGMSSFEGFDDDDVEVSPDGPEVVFPTAFETFAP